jgi:hypothetical protein
VLAVDTRADTLKNSAHFIRNLSKRERGEYEDNGQISIIRRFII